MRNLFWDGNLNCQYYRIVFNNDEFQASTDQRANFGDTGSSSVNILQTRDRHIKEHEDCHYHDWVHHDHGGQNGNNAEKHGHFGKRYHAESDH